MIIVDVVKRDFLQSFLKRVVDLLISISAIIILSPLLLVVALAIKLTSKGDIFYTQTRIGEGGRPFEMIKFRSMVQNAGSMKVALSDVNEMDGPVFKMKNDPRITAIGRFIRKHSIDELPQIINIIKGEMSVVGPRPPLPQEVEAYTAWQAKRLSVTPGLTCIWQVSGRNNITFDEWMQMDMNYIENWSLALDLKLIFKTFKVVLSGDGAY